MSSFLKTSVIAAACAALLLVPEAKAADPEVHLLFVQGAKAMEADTSASTIRLIGVADQTIYFSDRPHRVAGLATTEAFVANWGVGEDSFASNPPNATLMVYDAAADKHRASVLVLRDPLLDGDNLTYTYEVLGGTVPETGGATGLFIDTFGAGGGVGAGYHGVGVGARGPGAAGWRGVEIRECADANC